VSLNGTTANAQESQDAAQIKKNVQTVKPGQTKKTKNYTRNLESNKGMWLRSLPDPADGPLVAASWTNQDIVAPNPMYPAIGDPQCGDGFADSSGYWAPGGVIQPWPNGESDIEFFKNLCQDKSATPVFGASFANYAQVGMTAPGDKNFGVDTYYPTDSNSLDKRAVYDGNQYIFPTPDFKPSQQNQGRGCHATPDGQIDQVDARPGNDPNEPSLLLNPNCQCNVQFSGDNWSDWVSWWLENAFNSNSFAGNYWFEGNDLNTNFSTNNLGKAPNYAVDPSACWMTNKSDMIRLQQALWLRRGNWWNGLQPFTGGTYPNGPDDENNQKVYWGWNEIPAKKKMDNPKKWGAMLIKLPPGKTKLGKMSNFSLNILRQSIKTTMREMGVPYNNKKKSKVVMLIEKRTNSFTWERKYKCQGFKFNKSLKIEFQKKTKKKDGYCYIRN
jgi:hypothetical protein